MSSAKTSTTGTDWTQFLSDPVVARNLEALLRAYRDADPDKRDQAVRDTLEDIRSGMAGGEGQEQSQVCVPNLTSPSAIPPFSPQPEAGSQKEDRRRHPRTKCFVAVELRVQGSNAPIWGNLSNTSTGGCFVETTSLLETGVKLEIGLWVANGTIWVKGIIVNGIVTRSKPCLGVRIKFTDLEDKERETLREFLKFVDAATQGYNKQHGYLARIKR